MVPLSRYGLRVHRGKVLGALRNLFELAGVALCGLQKSVRVALALCVARLLVVVRLLAGARSVLRLGRLVGSGGARQLDLQP